LSGAALISLLYGTELASHQEARIAHAAGFIVAGVILGSIAVRHFRSVRDPLLDLTTLGVPTYAVTVLWGSATRIGIEAVPYLAPLLFQIGFGLSAFQSGLLLLATAIGNLGMKVFTSRILQRFGFRAVAMFASAAAAVFVAGYGWLYPATPLAVTLAVLFVYGLARSLQFTTLATLAYADVDDPQKGPASTLWSVAQQMTVGMGIAFGALCLRISTTLGAAPRLHPQVFVLGDFRWAFLAAGVLIAVSIVGYARLPADAGNTIAARS
jgi:MFS family permease